MLVCAAIPFLVGVVAASVGRRSGREDVLSLLGAGLAWPFALLVMFAGAGHCPQGDPETYIIGHLGNAFLFWLALPLLVGSAGEQSSFRLGVPFLTLGPLLLELPHAHAVVFQGAHLCGAERGEALYYLDDPFAAWYYPAHGAYALALTAAALWPWARRSSPLPTPSDT